MSSTAKVIAGVTQSLPLFPTDKRALVRSLCVRRNEEGRWVRAPESVDPGALPDRESVRLRFGGGRYEVIGRDGRRIVARTRFVLDGHARPFDPRRSPTAEARGSTDSSTMAGHRTKLVFALIEQGLDLMEIAQRTEFEPAIVRALSEDWLDLLDRSKQLQARLRDLSQLRRPTGEAEWEAVWDRR